MDLSQRINGLTGLGKYLNYINNDDFDDLVYAAEGKNSWFDKENITKAFNGLSLMLDHNSVKSFIKRYDLDHSSNKKIGIVMAGNIPAVGFHDLILVLLTGSKAVVKLSQQDEVIMKFLINVLLEIENNFEIEIVEKLILSDLDGVIATGSDNTSRYFESYFSKIPNVIRKNRTSVAVISGEESSESFNKLGKDIFQYYGLGCRNVSKLYVPNGYDFTPFLDELQSYVKVLRQHKYDNNYTYHKSVYLVNGRKHLDTGFLMLTEDLELHSPLSVIYYEYYNNSEEVFSKLQKIENQIQCCVSDINSDKVETKRFGESQSPTINDFADGVDIIEFILKL